MEGVWISLSGFWGERAFAFLRAALLVLGGLLLARILGSALVRALKDRLDNHRLQLLRRGVFYTVVVLFTISALREVGFQLHLLLGAAGILTVAVGFASQTSAANIVSGLFLIIERPFAIGDVIKVGDTTGEVVTIDLLSIKLRTFDNLLVRIPNESVVKSQVTNLTAFTIRRIDLPLSVAYKEDLRKLTGLLEQLADRNPLCLQEPKPLIILTGFGDSGITVQFSVWVARVNFLQVRNALYTEIKETLDAHGIEIPFPHVSLYRGAATEPFPVQIVEPSPTARGDG